MSSGVTMFFSDLPIFPYSRVTGSPCQVKPSGSIWVNLGDKYAGVGGPNQSGNAVGETARKQARTQNGLYDAASRNGGGVRSKSLFGVPWRYAIRCIDDLGLILRAEVIWSKPNGLPESVTDRVRRSHEQWFHFTLSPRYYSAVDEIREAHAGEFLSDGVTRNPRHKYGGVMPNEAGGKSSTSTPDRWSAASGLNPLGKLPGSVWTIPTQPLTVPAHLGVDHFAAFPMEWPRRIIRGWSPAGVCVACGEGRRPVIDRETPADLGPRIDGRNRQRQGQGPPGNGLNVQPTYLTGYACACPDTTGPTTPAVVLDPFGGTGTTALVASREVKT